LPTSELAGPGDGRDSSIHLDQEVTSALEYFRDLYENAPSGYLVLNMDGCILSANSPFLSLTGLSKGQETGLNFRTFLTSAGAIFYDSQILQPLLLSGRRDEIALDLKIGSRRIPVLANFSLVYESTEPTQIRVIVFNASDRRLFEKELLRSRKEAEQLSEVILHSSDAIVTAKLDGSVRTWNMGAANLFGYAGPEAVGVPLWRLILPEEKLELSHTAMKSLKRGLEFSWEGASRHKNGSEIEVSIKLTPHMEAPETLVAFSAMIRDVSKQKNSERALLQSEKLASVGRLASSIAHEINNPLAAVTNLLYLIDQQANTAALKELTETAQEELARVSQITSHTLRFHRQSSKPTDLNLKNLFESVVALYRARLRNSSISTEIRAHEVQLHCHEGELRQIVLNIVGNAIDAMKLGGKLYLRCRQARSAKMDVDGVRLVIADNGTGMDQATMARIFEPFFTTKGIGGTGLGLWVATDLVQRNGGYIKVRSSASSTTHGTIVTLFFPGKIVSGKEHGLSD
jgi:PAS domain S-box-containing protein